MRSFLSRQRASLTRQVTARLLLSFGIAALATFTAAYWFHLKAQETLVQQRAMETLEHFRGRIAQLEYEWENQTLRLKSQIEYAKVLENTDTRWLRLNGLLITLTGVAATGGLAISDREGRILYSFGTMADAVPPQTKFSSDSDWFYDAAENRIYHVYRQPLWLGREGAGKLLAFRILDNSVLFQNRYPGTELFLTWKDKVVASSTGDGGGNAPDPRFRGELASNGEFLNQYGLRWIEGKRDSPGLVVQQRIVNPVTRGDTLILASLVLVTLSFYSWLIVGRWMGHVTWRAQQLAQTANAFSAGQRLSQEIETGLSGARTELNDEIDDLAKSLAGLMKTVEANNLEQQLYQSELTRQMMELKRINGELDEFTNFASHDLREPLRKLVSFSDLLRTDVGPNLTAQAEEDLHYIVDAAARMRILVDALLDFSRAGKAAIVPQRVDMNQAAARALEALSLRIEESGARIVRDPLPPAMGDPILLTQLYQNLIGNALKYTAPGRVPEIRITHDPDSGAYGVKDNGIGIKPMFATQIFKPFKRLHSREEYEGSGIGLSICRKIVERHYGEIWVESEVGQGSHFKFNLGSHPPALPARNDTGEQA